MRVTTPDSDLFESAAVFVMQRRPAVHHAVMEGARLLAGCPEAPPPMLLRYPPAVGVIGPPELAPTPRPLLNTAALVRPHKLPRGGQRSC